MDMTFQCPVCNQELEVDSSAAGSSIDCPSCGNPLTVPAMELVEAEAVTVAEAAPAAPSARHEKHFTVPVHDRAPVEPLIQKPNKPLEVAARESDRTMRIKSIKRSECQEVGKDRFDEIVSAFLHKVGQDNVISINSINYSSLDLTTRTILTDYGVMIVYRG